MSRVKNQTPEERERQMYDIFQQWYADPANAGKDLSVAKANAEFTKRTGAMLRNKKAYAIRKSVKVQISRGGNGQQAKPVIAAARDSNTPALVEPTSIGAATLVQGNPEQIRFLKSVLAQLNAEGLCNLKVDHATDAYAVLARL